ESYGGGHHHEQSAALPPGPLPHRPPASSSFQPCCVLPWWALPPSGYVLDAPQAADTATPIEEFICTGGSRRRSCPVWRRGRPISAALAGVRSTSRQNVAVSTQVSTRTSSTLEASARTMPSRRRTTMTTSRTSG